MTRREDLRVRSHDRIAPLTYEKRSLRWAISKVWVEWRTSYLMSVIFRV